MILRLYNCDNATVDLSENVAVLELARQEIFNNVLLDFTETVFPARELAIDGGNDLLGNNDIICIRDYFDLSLKNKTLLNKLYKHVDSTVFSDPEERMNLENLISRLKQYFLDTLKCLNTSSISSATSSIAILPNSSSTFGQYSDFSDAIFIPLKNTFFMVFKS